MTAALLEPPTPVRPGRFLPSPEWHEQAACRGLGSEMFHPPTFTSHSGRRASAAALEVCGRCPVVEECLDVALSVSNDHHGIWGGTTPQERAEIRRNRTELLADDLMGPQGVTR